MPLRRSPGKYLPLVACLALSTALGIEAASPATGANPIRYRYTGVVENGRGIPTRYVARGDGVIFSFFDSFSQGRKSEPYRLCVGHSGRAPARCWNRTARYGVDTIVFTFTLPADVPVGELTARWLVRGRTVASWAFLYVLG
jgi:hypothetical protein